MGNQPIKKQFVATDGISEKKFIRNSLIYLYSAKDAPASISEVKLSEVGQDQIQYVWQHNLFDISYDVEIGYYRNEQYQDTEKYYDSVSKTYRTRNVIKNRTVTDWQPYSNQKSNISISSQRLLEIKSVRDMGQLDPEMQKKYEQAGYDNGPSDGPYREVTGDEREKYINEITENKCKEMIRDVANNYEFLHAVSNTIPGDTHRNFHADWKIRDVIPELYAVKRYKMTFEYPEGKGFIMQSEHGTDPIVYSDFHNADNTVKELEEAKKKQIDNDPLIQEKKKMLGKKELYTYIPSAAVALLGLLFHFLLLILGVAGIVATYLYFRNVAYKPIDERKAQISAEYDAKIKAYKEGGVQNRIEKLNARLVEMGQPELTKKELLWFTDEDLEHTLEEEVDEDDEDEDDEDEDEDDEDEDDEDEDDEDEVDLDDEDDE